MNTPSPSIPRPLGASRFPLHSFCRHIRPLVSLAAFFAIAVLPPFARGAETSDETQWPEIRKEARPWTRWFWLGSAVNEGELTRHLEAYRQAGLGGVEVSPIYGAKGYESQFIDFLSPRWMKILDHTSAEAARLGMGADMIEGTGWPFGGPNLRPQDSAQKAVVQTFPASGGQQITHAFKQKPVALMAVLPDGKAIDLTSQVDASGQLLWEAPAGEWKLYALLDEPTKQKVKRAAPGGEGPVLDPFSGEAMGRYLARFDEAFGADSHGIGAFFNDSFEAFGADWTPVFLDEFQKRRGYDLRARLAAFAGDGDPDIAARVRCDYRQTMSELLLDGFTRPWVDWCHRHGAQARNQAHGSPGNLLDLYAAADIPETESGEAGADVAFSKFASSAAHLRDRPLASSESCTWLDEHFRVTPAKIKTCLDGLFLAGINHVFYHAMVYSPSEAPWPGWLFYASVDFGPGGGLWRDFPALNAYVTRCQSFLQLGRSDNDVLLYHPVPDLWMENVAANGRLQGMTVTGAAKWLHAEPVGIAADRLLARGYTFDYISDALLHERQTAGVIVAPRCRFMPAATLLELLRLANSGATVLFEGLPQDVPGLADLENQRRQFHEALESIHWAGDPGADIRSAVMGRGRLCAGENLDALLVSARVRREPMADRGLQFVRRLDADGAHYFVVNHAADRFDGWLPLAVPAVAAVLFDPESGRSGGAAMRSTALGSEIYAQMEPGQTLIVRTFATRQLRAPDWTYLAPADPAQPVAGPWDLHFFEGGPELPPDVKLDQLVSWPDLPDPTARNFSGAGRYTVRFDKPAGNAADWLLDLGEVHETVRVKLNGRDLGTLWHAPYRILLGKGLSEGSNVLELEVTNLAANRIADLDRRKVSWKTFYDTNFVNIKYKPFDASTWEPLPSGLLGPVKLFPYKIQEIPGAGNVE